MRVAVGIDFGTTCCAIAVYQNGRIDVLPNDQKSRITSSYLAITKKGNFFGTEARKCLVDNAQNTLYDLKRLIGRDFDDPVVRNLIMQWTFQVIDSNNHPKIEITKCLKHYYSPEEVVSMLLKYLIQCAQQYVKGKITDAVISIPAYFNNHQRQAIRRAGGLAGVNVLQLLHEPSASALAYKYEQRNSIDELIVIYDLGGGCFDLAVIRIKNNCFTVLAVNGDSSLGGQDFDDLLVAHCLEQFKPGQNVDHQVGICERNRLKLECEDAKCRLTSTEVADVKLDNFGGEKTHKVEITRKKFEGLISNLLNRTILMLTQVLQDAGVEKHQVDEILLAGGSTRIPVISDILSAYFDGKKPLKILYPEESVAQGAAILAANLVKPTTTQLNLPIVTLIDVTPMTLGVGISGGVVVALIKRNTPIPVNICKAGLTSTDNQPFCFLPVYEGERILEIDNNVYGEYSLTGYPLGKQGDVDIRVCLMLDSSGCLQMSAYQLHGAKQTRLKMVKVETMRRVQYADRMRMGAEMHEQIDEEYRIRYGKWRDGLLMSLRIKRKLEHDVDKQKIPLEVYKQINLKCDNAVDWLLEHELPTLQQWETKLSELNDIYEILITPEKTS